ncbi:MAG: Uncharacterised protein [Cellulomonadaceae bacterium TMED98]|nr:MAG: Uncharacterised protein [Cellulomonadaceae bacterium TMED98]
MEVFFDAWAIFQLSPTLTISRVERAGRHVLGVPPVYCFSPTKPGDMEVLWRRKTAYP